jgi:hypothetical protein
MQMTLARIYKKAGLENPKELAAGNMEDEVTMTGPLRAVLELITATIEEEQSLTEEQSMSGKDKLTTALTKAGIDTSEPINVKIINKATGKEQIVKYDGDSFSNANVEEGLKDKIVLGATCFILASGLISCTKGGGGYGYNVSVKSITYDLDKPGRTEEVTVVTPNGERTEMVNPGDTARFTWFGHGIHVATKPSAQELQIAAFGATIRREQSSNNGRGYPANHFKSAAEIEIKSNPGYTDESSGEPAPSIHEHEDYKVGKASISQFPERWAEFKQENPVQNYENL